LSAHLLFSALQDFISSAIQDIGWRHIPDCLVVAAEAVTVDEVGNRPFQLNPVGTTKAMPSTKIRDEVSRDPDDGNDASLGSWRYRADLCPFSSTTTRRGEVFFS